MKLVIATPLYPPEIGGPSTYAKLLVEGLPAKGMDSTGSPQVEVEVVKFSEVREWPKGLKHFVYFLNVRRALARADLCLALDPVSVGLPTYLAARSLGKPYIVKIVGDYAWEQGRQRFGITATLDEFVTMKRVPFFVSMFQWIQSRVARSATRIIVPSEYLKTIVSTWGSPLHGSGEPSIPAEKIEVIYNAVPTDTIGAVPSAVAELPRPLVVTAGRLVPWKHVDAVIDAVAALKALGSPASLVVVGDGPDREELLRHAIATLGAGFVFTDALAHADLLAVMKSSDVFVLNSSYEGLSHLLIEALSLGVPTIATHVGGNSEVITDEETGLLVPSADTPALVAALSRLLSDGALASSLSRGAIESSRRFSLGTMLSATAALLFDLRSRTS